MMSHNDVRAVLQPDVSASSRRPSIPPLAHLVWFGAEFPWVNLLAVRSAALRGSFSEVVLHHESDLRGTPYFAELVAIPGVRLKRIHIPQLLEACGDYRRELGIVFGRLRTPATRSDLLRFAFLYSEGGIYLDMDTVTIRDLTSLCEGVNGFCGLERIVYPAAVRDAGGLCVPIGAAARSLLRSALRLAPRGWLAFRHVQSLFHLAANPAVLASAARSPFITESIIGLLNTPPDRQPNPNVLGPHLLQNTLGAYRGSDVAVHAPEVFFPLAPELSAHWFRTDSGGNLSSAISLNTRVVHWYASVRTKHITPKITPAYVRKFASTQLFSALALPFVDA